MRAADEAPDDGASSARREGWIEFILSVVLAVAAVGTAWAGFQSAKWSGVQANSYASASATRTESTRRSTEAGQFLTIDVIMFTQWLNALNEEILADPSKRSEIEGRYRPDPEAISGLLFTRFRTEFKPAVHAWLESRPLTVPTRPAPRSPCRSTASRRRRRRTNGSKRPSASPRRPARRTSAPTTTS